MTADGEDSGVQARRPESQSRASLWTKLHLDDVTKILALCGGILYGILFIAYRVYYDALNLSPEDVGVDPIYVLVRSPGFVIAILLLAAVARGLASLWRGKRRREGYAQTMRGAYISLFAITVTIATFLSTAVYWHEGTHLLVIAIVTVAILGLGLYAFRRGVRAEVPLQYLELCVSAFAAASIVASVTIGACLLRGQWAADGDAVQPYNFFGLVIVDVSAPRVSVLWSDPKTPYPDYFGKGPTPNAATGTLIGQTSTSIVVNLDLGGLHRIVRFDARQVIVEFEGS